MALRSRWGTRRTLPRDAPAAGDHSVVDGTENARVATAAALDHRLLSGHGRRAAGLAHRVGERLQVVRARSGADLVRGEAQHLPAARRGQALRVLGAQVV